MRKCPVNAIPGLHCSDNSKIKNGKSEKQKHRKESKRKNTRLEKSNKIKSPAHRESAENRKTTYRIKGTFWGIILV